MTKIKDIKDWKPVTHAEAKKMVDTALELCAQIHPMLEGKGPEVQGSVIADMLATYMAGHHPDARKTVLDALLATVNKLIPVIEEAAQTPWPRAEAPSGNTIN